MPLQTQASVAIITGGSGGIGGAIARKLAALGYRLAIHANGNVDKAVALAEEIVATGGEALPFQADLTDSDAVAAMIAAVLEGFGRVDVLVNNSGICTPAPLGEMAPDMIDRELAVNVKSVVLATQACLPHMSAGAAIVNVSSNLAYAPLPGMTLYCATKAAVSCLTQGFARELGPRGIRVNAVAPGATRTAMTDWIDEASMSGIAAATPLGRVAMPDDVAGAVALLVSSDAGWVTGRTLIVDGGLA